MVAQAQCLLQAPTHFTYHSQSPNSVITKNNIKQSINQLTRCSTRSRFNWDSNAEPRASGNGRFRFNLEDELYTDGGDDFSAKPRRWWSEYDYDNDDDGEFDEEDEALIFKIFRAFGWMLPAIAIPLLLGTSPNALFMALIPLGQSILTLAFDKVWARTGNSPKSRPRAKRKRKPFARAESESKTSQGKPENETANSQRSYQSWVAADGVSYEKRDKTGPRFGGWDDLEEKLGNKRHGAAGSKPPSRVKSERPKQQKKVKQSRMVRTRETPLLLRLLIAVFPFLGSWTKLLF